MIIKKIEFKDTPLSNIDLRKWCDFLRIPIKGIFSRNESKPRRHSPCIINLDDFGNLGTHWVCCWHAKNGTYECFDSFGLPPLGKGNVSARKETFFQKHQPNSMGTKCEMWLLLPCLFKRKKQRHKFHQHFENVHRRCPSKRTHRKELFFITYTKMEVYCVKEKRHTPNVKGSEKVVLTKNNRKLLKAKCASCGITETHLLPGN